ncbi:hypothetical protein D3C72_1443220 [compost metagenome]
MSALLCPLLQVAQVVGGVPTVLIVNGAPPTVALIGVPAVGVGTAVTNLAIFQPVKYCELAATGVSACAAMHTSRAAHSPNVSLVVLIPVLCYKEFIYIIN